MVTDRLDTAAFPALAGKTTPWMRRSDRTNHRKTRTFLWHQPGHRDGRQDGQEVPNQRQTPTARGDERHAVDPRSVFAHFMARWGGRNGRGGHRCHETVRGIPQKDVGHRAMDLSRRWRLRIRRIHVLCLVLLQIIYVVRWWKSVGSRWWIFFPHDIESNFILLLEASPHWETRYSTKNETQRGAEKIFFSLSQADDRRCYTPPASLWITAGVGVKTGAITCTCHR